MQRLILTPRQAQQLDAVLAQIAARAAEVRAELARLGEREFARRYETGPRQPAFFR